MRAGIRRSGTFNMGMRRLTRNYRLTLVNRPGQLPAGPNTSPVDT